MKNYFLPLLAILLVNSSYAANERKVDAGVLQFKQTTGATPSPSSGYNHVFTKADGKVYVSGSAGVGSIEQLHSGAESLSSALFTGTLPVTKGGIGVATVTPSAILYGNGTSAMTSLAIGGSTQVLKGGIIPNYGAVVLTTDVSGALPIANGGSGQATQTNAFDALSPNTTKGDIAVYNGSDNIRLAVGTNDFVLTADSSAASGIKWASSSGGGGSSSQTSMVRLQTTNGHGATSTKIVRWTTTITNTGTDITYLDNANTGGTFTINTAGVYCFTGSIGSSTTQNWGLSLNSNQLTTDINAITASHILYEADSAANGLILSLVWCGILAPSDVIRVHDQGGANLGTSRENFTAVKVSN